MQSAFRQLRSRSRSGKRNQRRPNLIGEWIEAHRGVVIDEHRRIARRLLRGAGNELRRRLIAHAALHDARVLAATISKPMTAQESATEKSVTRRHKKRERAAEREPAETRLHHPAFDEGARQSKATVRLQAEPQLKAPQLKAAPQLKPQRHSKAKRRRNAFRRRPTSRATARMTAAAASSSKDAAAKFAERAILFRTVGTAPDAVARRARCFRRRPAR